MTNVKNPKVYLPIIVVVALLVVGFLFAKKPVVSPETTKEAQAVQKISVEQKIFESTNDEKGFVKYTVSKGESALDLLKNSEPDVKMKDEGKNAFITSIRGSTADEAKKEYWALYINGEPAEVGAGSYILLPGDQIEWKIKTF
ncbi:hypothetical protein A2799_00695 [Candidatus Roizmanbacteria bacterium RIFCSPHIGHO2_01_FULL_39_24]|uniref:Transcobalamin-like C-terminal domain-containing protein n=1 Tax=Candidatus Roizmanbacteria bacterium RIFCSPHIGHO2_01_FULL_39_24 TaxID=1802032 RepID=A0A1F7GIG7_9BACT|nr:MAG: hypothetical protein A2799_00695 [Candidatus Roizmanbacteria bacterium RIFCSPHIGHO2_01_FULL_39_24]OGK49726.1 MAG: hypothetical protein A3A56_03925 [Candidatus Roizmanbacteria bacterium RIFCSPLOWO2_01_FULL_40_32]